MDSAKFSITNEGPVKNLYSGDILIGTFQPGPDTRVKVVDTITEVEPGLFEWQREFSVVEAVSGARLTMDFAVSHSMLYGLIPAVSYNGNPWGPGLEIKGFALEGKPWTVAYHRVAVCGGTYSESSDWS